VKGGFPIAPLDPFGYNMGENESVWGWHQVTHFGEKKLPACAGRAV